MTLERDYFAWASITHGWLLHRLVHALYRTFSMSLWGLGLGAQLGANGRGSVFPDGGTRNRRRVPNPADPEGSAYTASLRLGDGPAVA